MVSGPQPALKESGGEAASDERHLWGFSWRPGALLRIALVATAVAYVQTITYAFVFDDLLQIEMNPWIQSWRFWRSFFTGDVWSFGRPMVHGNYYRPLFMLWLTGNFSLFKLTPGWWHLAIVGTHALATVLVYVLAARLLNDRWSGGVAALLFGLYPLHIESVAWISGIPEVLLTIFVVGSLLAYQDWVRTRRWTWSAFSLLLFAAALLSKETALAFIPILGAYVWTDNAKTSGSRMRRVFGLWPYIVIGAAYLVVRGVVLSGLAASNYPRPLSWVGLTVPAALWFYLRRLLWPFGVSLFYDFDLARTFSLMGVAVPLLLSMLAIGLFIHAGRRRGLGLLAATWILTPLAPVLAGMKYFQWHDYVHDRYLYLPSVMTAILLAASLKNGAEWLAKKRGFESIGRVQAASIAIVAMVFAISTIRQSRQWESDLAVFSHAHERAPRNPVPVDYMARTLYGLGRADEAVAAYRGLLQTDPDYWQANYVLGLAYYQMGQIDEAKKYLKIATQVWPRDFIRPEPAQFYYLGMVQLRKSEYADAEISLRKAVELRPTAVGYRNALGTALQHLGHTEEAQQQFRLEAENRKAFDARQREFDTN